MTRLHVLHVLGPVLLLVLLGCGGPGGRVDLSVPAGPGEAVGSDRGAAALLRAWDVRRARAWAHGDRAALARLYVPGSSAGRHDLAMLRAWSERGLRVRGMQMQLLAVRVRARTADRLVLDVTDRLARAVAVGPQGRADLPGDSASTRTVVLRRLAGEWRVARVTLRPVPAPAPSPGQR